MSEITLNIVAFDIPFPADYGGSIDIFYKLRTLHKKGVSIILHCFKYNKGEQQELEKYCEKVIYYPRKNGPRYIFSRLPYVVATRNNRQLLKNLLQNDHPILFEGLHTCYFLAAKKLAKRKKFVRTHNIEHDYYNGLYLASDNLLKRTYYLLESRKLKRYEKVLKHATALIAITTDDQKYFVSKYCNTYCIPAFHPFDRISIDPGKGSYYLYHGNLAVEENQKAVHFLLNEVFNKVESKLIITGKNPGTDICNRVNEMPNVELVSNPSQEQMIDLLRNAHGSVLPTFQDTGLKLKLLIALFSTRFVIANNLMVQHTSLYEMCEIAYTSDEFRIAVNKLANEEFTQHMLDERIVKLEAFTNDYNGDLLMNILQS